MSRHPLSNIDACVLYDEQDAEFAERIRHALQRSGLITAPAPLPGDALDVVTPSAITGSKLVLFLLSAEPSDNLRESVAVAIGCRPRPLAISVLVGDAKAPYGLGRLQPIRLAQRDVTWLMGELCPRLVQLKRTTATGPPPAPSQSWRRLKEGVLDVARSVVGRKWL